ncbi:TniB family NTP-binding protein [Bradyrhizobium iriomotense]|uniref:ATP-binding protein n=1 Tax=Bradyrhizobium iriomotense TaxID=441950 RepID=A0ABQ6BED4_9BRAD|nr:TniB family NTP-binding protein [Bradyrhizobium iriomotense]GLR92133.1 hypothetical protein GCM10007857_88520 [Bradyrhizobium iriomotense]
MKSKAPSTPPESDPPSNDPIKLWRRLSGPTTLKHVALMEKLKAHYVTTSRDDDLAQKIDLMIMDNMERRDLSRPEGVDNRGEGSAIAIIAPSGAGKTKAMQHFLKDNPYFPNYRNPKGGCPLITIQTRAPATLGQLGLATVHACGYRTKTHLPENEAWALARFQMQHQNILVPHFEEAQRIIKQKNRLERSKIVETFAGLMTDLDWPVNPIISGLRELRRLFDDDFLDEPTPEARESHTTLTRRTRFVEFHPIDPKHDRKDLDRGLGEYEKLAGVSLKAAKETEMRARICHGAARQFGLFFELTVLAIGVCVLSGRKVVTQQDYADGYAARTLQPVELNVFVSDYWQDIDTSIIQHRPKEEDDEDEPKTKKGKPRRSDP